MDDPLLVGRFEGFGDLLGDGQGFVDRDRPLRDAVRQRRPLDEFKDQRLDAVRLLQPVDAPDVGMVQRGEHLGLTLEAGQPVRVGGERLGENLERHVAVELGVAGLIDLTSSRQESPRATGRCSSSPLAACFRGGATISRPYPSCTPAPLRTGQADFPYIRLLGQSFSEPPRDDPSAVVAGPHVVDVGDTVRPGGNHQRRVGAGLVAYPCRVCGHRVFAPCIASMFLPSRSTHRGDLRSAGVSRVIARPLRHTGPHHLRRGHPHALFLHWAGYSGYYEERLPKSRDRRSPGYLPVFE